MERAIAVFWKVYREVFVRLMQVTHTHFRRTGDIIVRCSDAEYWSMSGELGLQQVDETSAH